MSAQDSFDKNFVENNVVENTRDLKARLAQLEVAGNNSVQPGDDVVGSRIIATTNPENAEPTDAAFDGAFIAATEQTMADGTQDAWLAKINAGEVEFSVGVDGIYQNRLTNGYKHIADDGTTYRRGDLGMTTLNGKTAPSFGLTYTDNNQTATEKLTNGGFEAGSFTGWTNNSVGGAASVSSNSNMTGKVGTYYAISSSTGTVDQAFDMAAGRLLTISALAQKGSGNAILYVYFYSGSLGAGTLVSSDTMIIHTLTSTGSYSKSYIVPSGAASVIIKLSSEATFAYFDNVSALDYGISANNYLGFDPVNGKLVSKMLDVINQPLGQFSVGSMTVLRVEEAKDKLTATPGAAGNVNVGTHGVVTTFVDAYGETDADLTQASTAVVATSAKTVALSAIPLGKWGTTSRKVYGTIAGATTTDPTAYYLITTIGDNTTTTGTYNISDATLITGTQLPTVNTTGSRPVWPRTDSVQAMQIISNASGSITGQLNSSTYTLSYVWGLSTADANDGDEYYFSVMLEAGTYTVYIDGATSSTAGKLDWYIDGVLATSGQDWYTAGNPFGRKSFSATITTSGYHHVLVKVNGKNASSTDYRWLWSVVSFVPAAY